MRSGDMIGSYRVDAVGTADFAVTHLVTQRPARLRWIDPIGDPTVFIQAARRVCGLQAPMLHGLIDVGIEGDRCYLVDGPLPGEALVDHIARVGRLTGDALLGFAESLFGAVIELHGRQVYDGALHPGRVRIVNGLACVTEPGVGRLLSRLAPPPEFCLPADAPRSGTASDLFAAAAIVCFVAHGRAKPAAEAAKGTGIATPIIDLLRQCLAPAAGEGPDAASVRRTIQAVRAGTLASEPGEQPANGADEGWLTDASVEAPAPQSFDPGYIPDELPAARAPMGVIAPRPARAAPSGHSPAPSPAPDRPAAPIRSARVAATPAPKARSGAGGLVWIAAALLLLGIASLVAWRLLAPPRAEIGPDPAPVAAPQTDPAPPSVASAASAAPETIDKYAFVTLVAQPGPARFIQVESETVLCESAEDCRVPIDIDTRIEKAGYSPRVISGDDLYDQRGNRWTIRLRTLP